MIIHIFGLLAMVVGVLLYFLATNAKLSEIGRIAIACGLLVVLDRLAVVVRL